MALVEENHEESLRDAARKVFSASGFGAQGAVLTEPVVSAPDLLRSPPSDGLYPYRCASR
jgi:hypothetical protein